MIVLVANLGSTSFKYKLFEFTNGEERVLAIGTADRIGLERSNWSIGVGGVNTDGEATFADHGAAIDHHLAQLTGSGVIASIDAIEAIGFKAVHGGPISGAVVVDDQVIETMNQFADVAPAHNPPYVAAMRAFAERLPGIPQVAAFETAFHQTIPDHRRTYAIPHDWTDRLAIKRYGFHGASHRYIAARIAQLQPDAKRVISCHLGGSCSICAIEDGRSVANSFGMTAQSGLPHANRVGDFDTFALLKLRAAGIDLETIFKRLGSEGGLAGISGVSSDLRDIRTAAGAGNSHAQLAVDVFVDSIRHYIAAYLGVLNGADAICFTGGIGQHDHDIRSAALMNFNYAGIELDEQSNGSAQPDAETRIDTANSAAAIWVLPTNEELIVARQTVETIRNSQTAQVNNN